MSLVTSVCSKRCNLDAGVSWRRQNRVKIKKYEFGRKSFELVGKIKSYHESKGKIRASIEHEKIYNY